MTRYRKKKRRTSKSSFSPAAETPRPAAPRTPTEREQQEQALRRERALLWTDDKPFSIWKS